MPDPVRVWPGVSKTNSAGQIAQTVTGCGDWVILYFQAVVLDASQPNGFQISNALLVEFH